jgi:hypothetical protein
MSRRTSLPGAAELFRATSSAPEQDEPVADHQQVFASAPAVAETVEYEPRYEPARELVRDQPLEPDRRGAASSALGATTAPATPSGSRSVRSTRRIRAVADRGPTGRERHDEKITVYCSPEELLDLERARLALRAEHGLAVDRGRIVREAIAVVLADLEAKGETSILVRRLREA